MLFQCGVRVEPARRHPSAVSLRLYIVLHACLCSLHQFGFDVPLRCNTCARRRRPHSSRRAVYEGDQATFDRSRDRGERTNEGILYSPKLARGLTPGRGRQPPPIVRTPEDNGPPKQQPSLAAPRIARVQPTSVTSVPVVAVDVPVIAVDAQGLVIEEKSDIDTLGGNEEQESNQDGDGDSSAEGLPHMIQRALVKVPRVHVVTSGTYMGGGV